MEGHVSGTKASFYTSFHPLCPGGDTRLWACSRPGFPRGRKELVPLTHVNNAVLEFKERKINALIVLLSDAESQKYYNTDLVSYYRNHGLFALRYPIVDHDVPTFEMMLKCVKTVHGLLSGEPLTLGQHVGKYKFEPTATKIAVHCSAGIGRTNTVGACLAAYFGPKWKFGQPQTADQREFVNAFWKYMKDNNHLSPEAAKAAAAGWVFHCVPPLNQQDWRTNQSL